MRIVQRFRMLHLLGVILASLTGACALTDKSTDDMLSVSVVHPALNGGKAFKHTLSVVRDTAGCPWEYSLDVDSVSCGDKVCDVVKVRMYFDALGGFLRYELPAGGDLTRKEHSRFSAADHEKLRTILSDPDSRLKDFKPETISAPALNQAHDVDAVTKPTPLFYQNSVVKGAVYTCYTLWHWANGSVPATIRELTAASCTYEHLMAYVNEGSEKFFLFATEQLAERGRYDGATVAAVVNRANSGRAVFVQGALDYLESSLGRGDAAVYCDALLLMFAKGNSQKRTLCLRSLGDVDIKTPAGFYNRLSEFLPELESYFELHLLLKMLDERNPGSAETVRQVARVLGNDNFLVARRAYWYLKEQKLTDAQAAAVAAFEKQYEGRL